MKKEKGGRSQRGEEGGREGGIKKKEWGKGSVKWFNKKKERKVDRGRGGGGGKMEERGR